MFMYKISKNVKEIWILVSTLQLTISTVPYLFFDYFQIYFQIFSPIYFCATNQSQLLYTIQEFLKCAALCHVTGYNKFSDNEMT